MPLVLAVDFDRTICDTDGLYSPIPAGKKLGNLMEHVKEALDAIHEAGHHIIIHSCRSSDGPRSDKVMTDYLDHFGIHYDEVWNKVGKPKADYYIDDKAMPFTNWYDIEEALVHG